MDDLDDEQHESQDLAVSGHDDDQDEFEGATAEDRPSSLYMKRQISAEKDDVFEDIEKRASGNLDDERHESLGDLVVASGHGNEEDEFGGADTEDQPSEKYLLRQVSVDLDEVLSHQSDENLLQNSNLDDERHEDLGDLVMSDQENDEDEFEGATTEDQPSPAYMNRQISADKDDLLEEIDRHASSSNLDDERHEDLGDLVVSGHENTEDEFGGADTFEQPSAKYLRKQISVDLDEVLSDQSDDNGMQNSNIDDECHEDLGDLVVSDQDNDEDEFEGATEEDKPSENYLARQISADNDDILSIESENSAPHMGSLDDERHEDLDSLLSEPDSDDDDFVTAGAEENPSATYLRAQDSMQDLSFNDSKREVSVGESTLVELDDEKHDSLGFDIRDEPNDGEEFQMAGNDDEPVSDYLMAQDSQNDLYFVSR